MDALLRNDNRTGSPASSRQGGDSGDEWETASDDDSRNHSSIYGEDEVVLARREAATGDTSDYDDDSFMGGGGQLPHPLEDWFPQQYNAPLVWFQQSDDGSHTDIREEGQENSFLDAPESLWEEPAVENVLTHRGNVRNYHYHGTGTIIHDQDISACLPSSPIPSDPNHKPLSAQPPPDGPDRLIPFSCRSDGSCKCGVSTGEEQPEPLSVYSGPLPSDDHIRLLEILPGGGGTAMECRLHIALLPQDKYTYEALSYTWVIESIFGNDKDWPQVIRCNGMYIPVSLNLCAALYHLRYIDAPRIIWADALCINQSDLRERSHQVGRMRSIYENAFRLVIFLGPQKTFAFQPVPPVHLSLPFRAFSGVCSVVNAWREKSIFQDLIPEARHTSAYPRPREEYHDLLASDSESWHDIFDLFQARWFQRVWVIQEVALARKVVVYWDQAKISWEYIGLAAAVIRTNYDRIASSIRQGPRRGIHPQFGALRRVPLGVVNAYFMYRLCRSQAYNVPLKFSFYELLKLTRQFDCMDDRDRVYGLLGLPTTDDIPGQIVPDYNKSPGEVYFDVATKMIDSSGLSILSSVQRKHKRGSMRMYYVPRWEAYDVTVPSWVPQWSFLLAQSLRPPHESNAGTRFRASGDKPYSRQRDDQNPRKLTVRGVFVDRVKFCGYPSFNSFWRGQTEADSGRFIPGRLEKRGDQEQPPTAREKLRSILKSLRPTRSELESIALNLTAGQNWYGFPVEDIKTHLADYCRCLLKDGLAWSLSAYLKRAALVLHDFGSSDNGGEAEVDPVEMEAEGDFVTLEELEKLSDGGHADRFLDMAATVCSRRAKFDTAGGLVGLGPEAMREDDQLCVLYGADMPFIIRKKSAGFALVGECYVQDLMQGQAVDGSIPGFQEQLLESWINLV